MNGLLIRVSSALYNCADVLVNGQKQDFVNNNRGSYELNIEEDTAEIQIVRRHELLSPAWLFWGLLFFIISCFGIFDVRYDKKTPLICRFNVTCQGNGGTVQFTPHIKKDGTGVVVANDNCVVDTLENSSDIAVIKKRRKALTIIKLLLWLALIATIVVLVIFKG